MVARPPRRESEAICPRSVGATSPEMSETNEINETTRGPGHGSGSRVGTNVGTSSQRWKSVLTLRLDLDPAVRRYLQGWLEALRRIPSLGILLNATGPGHYLSRATLGRISKLEIRPNARMP